MERVRKGLVNKTSLGKTGWRVLTLFFIGRHDELILFRVAGYGLREKKIGV